MTIGKRGFYYSKEKVANKKHKDSREHRYSSYKEQSLGWNWAPKAAAAQGWNPDLIKENTFVAHW